MPSRLAEEGVLGRIAEVARGKVRQARGGCGVLALEDAVWSSLWLVVAPAGSRAELPRRFASAEGLDLLADAVLREVAARPRPRLLRKPGLLEIGLGAESVRRRRLVFAAGLVTKGASGVVQGSRAHVARLLLQLRLGDVKLLAGHTRRGSEAVRCRRRLGRKLLLPEHARRLGRHAAWVNVRHLPPGAEPVASPSRARPSPAPFAAAFPLRLRQTPRRLPSGAFSGERPPSRADESRARARRAHEARTTTRNSAPRAPWQKSRTEPWRCRCPAATRTYLGGLGRGGGQGTRLLPAPPLKPPVRAVQAQPPKATALNRRRSGRSARSGSC